MHTLDKLMRMWTEAGTLARCVQTDVGDTGDGAQTCVQRVQMENPDRARNRTSKPPTPRPALLATGASQC